MTEKDKHTCWLETPQSGYGPAVTFCHEDEEGKLWAENGEYASQVNYCPFCGFRAPTQIETE